ncbi:MAG: transcriptional repressor NrdR [Ruminococcaceae bacterium]|nr:transcriptional repressor NrdR [Oscillospiraceae bacterium]
MKCPFCGYVESKVLDTRSVDDGSKIRRRRECLSCSKRFTSYETIELLPIIVIKRDKTREPFDRNKLMNGILRACEKRPISVDTIHRVVDEIETTLQNRLEAEVSSAQIGELTCEKLKEIDDVAYVRFASVYRQFGDLNTFMAELKKLISDETEKK